MALDESDVSDEGARALNSVLRALEAGVSVGADAWLAGWPRCRVGSLLLGVAAYLAPRPRFLLTAAACARDALPASSSAPSRPLVEGIEVVEACALGEASPRDAREAGSRAYGTQSRRYAGIDDSVAMAVSDACDLAAGEAFDIYGPNPAYRSAWAWAWRRCGDPTRPRSDEEKAAAIRAYWDHEAALADLVRRMISLSAAG